MHKPAHAGVMVDTNSLGMRDTEPLPDSTPKLQRIVALGDSFTFGFGVEGANTWPNVLERLLNASHDGNRYDVLNFGVGGYSTRDEALVLHHKALQWHPQLIIIGYFLNDPETDPIQPLGAWFHRPAWWQHWQLLRRLALAIHNHELADNGNDYYRYLHDPALSKWQLTEQAFDAIRTDAARDGCAVSPSSTCSMHLSPLIRVP